jgi:hypothetical protein
LGPIQLMRRVHRTISMPARDFAWFQHPDILFTDRVVCKDRRSLTAFIQTQSSVRGLVAIWPARTTEVELMAKTSVGHALTHCVQPIQLSYTRTWCLTKPTQGQERLMYCTLTIHIGTCWYPLSLYRVSTFLHFFRAASRTIPGTTIVSKGHPIPRSRGQAIDDRIPGPNMSPKMTEKWFKGNSSPCRFGPKTHYVAHEMDFLKIRQLSPKLYQLSPTFAKKSETYPI